MNIFIICKYDFVCIGRFTELNNRVPFDAFFHISHMKSIIVPKVFQSFIILLKMTLQWRHNEHDGVSNHQSYDCLINRLFRLRWKKASKLRVTGLCKGNSPVTGEFPAQRASNVENVPIWWCHHDIWCQLKVTIAILYFRTEVTGLPNKCPAYG